MIVVDAGAFLELLLRSPVGVRVERAMEDEHAYAPHLLDAEVLHRLLTAGMQGLLDPFDVDTGVADLRDAPIVRVDHRPLLDAARRFGAALSGSDALYAALADLLSCPLVTTDGRLARTVQAQFGVAAVDVGTTGR